MKAYLLSPCISLIDSVADELVSSGKDFSSNLVVFPGKRPAHFLRKALSLRAGGSFIPPLILSMDEFIDRAFESIDNRPKIDLLDAISLLFDIHCRMSKRIGGEDFNFLDEFFGLGVRLFRDIEELMIEQVPSSKINSVLEMAVESTMELSSKRTASLREFYERFYEKIESEKLSTRALRYKIVSERLEETDILDFERVALAGFFALTVSEEKIFKKLALMDNSRLYFQSGPFISEKLSQIGITPEKRECGVLAPSIEFTSSPDAHGQVFALADRLRIIKENGAVSEQVAVILPSSETLFPVIRQGLQDFSQEEFNISMGYPLVRTPVFAFIQALADLIAGADGENIPIAEYMSFVLHPYTKNIYFKGGSEKTRVIFHGIEEYYARKSLKTYINLDEIESDKELLDFVKEKLSNYESAEKHNEIRNHISKIHNIAIRPFFEIRDISDFSLKLSTLLEFIAERSTAVFHPFFTPFCESFVEALEEVSKSLLGSRSFSDRVGYFAFFKRYLLTRRAPFDGTPLRGLQILGFLETRGLKFERVFILDANEGVLPDTKREDSLIPVRARELLGLPTYRDRDKITSYYFDVLIKGAREASIYFVDNDRKEKSRFVEKKLWDIQKERGEIENGGLIKTIQYKVSLENTEPGVVAKSVEIIEQLKNFAFSPSSIDAYLACPLKFYYRYILKLREKEEAGEGIERIDIGQIVHTVLKKYFESRLNRPLTPSDINGEEIYDLTTNVFEEFCGGNPTGGGYLVMSQTRKRMVEYIDKYLAKVVANSQVVVMEVEPEKTAHFNEFILKGRLDCVQRRNGRVCIIDYKTSANKSAYKIAFDKLDAEKRETWTNIKTMQLPIYRILYSDEHEIDSSDVDAMFHMLGMSRMSEEIELPLFGRDDKEIGANSRLIENILYEILKEILDAKIPFSPTQNKRLYCNICEFTTICGTQWAVDYKRED